jgi:hypothetical protein
MGHLQNDANRERRSQPNAHKSQLNRRSVSELRAFATLLATLLATSLATSLGRLGSQAFATLEAGDEPLPSILNPTRSVAGAVLPVVNEGCVRPGAC